MKAKFLFILVSLMTVMLCVFAQARIENYVVEPFESSMGRAYPILESESELSVARCGVLCSESPFCSMFLYAASDQKCVIFGITNNTIPVPQTTNIQHTDNWKSFVLESGCPYLYVKALRKCWNIGATIQMKPDAQMYCSGLNGNLIELKSVEELEFVRGLLLSTPFWSTREYWVGAQRSKLQYQWKSDDVVIAPDLWGKDQPDSYGGPNQDCVDLLEEFKFYLNDIICTANRSAICDVPFSL